MTSALLIILLPVQFYILATNLSYADHPYSWNVVHGPNWSKILKIPTGGQVAFDRWIRVSCSFLVFVFFGTGTEAMTMYRKWLHRSSAVRWLPGWSKLREGRIKDRLDHLGSRAKNILELRSSAKATKRSL